jgi:Phage virion morphogenesis family
MIAVTVTSRLSPGQAEQQLLALPNRLRSLDVFARFALAPLALSMVQQHWASKGAAFGHPWAPWAPSTLKERIRKGNTQLGILHDTGHLESAVMAAAQSPQITATATGVRLSITVSPADDPKAAFHQFGTSRMPARQVLPSPFPRSFRDPVRQLLRDFVLTGQLRGAGGLFVARSGQ